jgi:FkbM family methyltransferase
MNNKIQQWENVFINWLQPTIEDIIQHLPNDYTFIDIGANTGLLSKSITDKRNDYKQVYMFEPITEYFDACKEKFDGNDKVTIYNVGMSNQIETKKIKLDGSNLGYNKIGDNGDMDIQLITFTQFAKEVNLTNVDFIKIDTEGYDTKVLSGMEEWIKGIERNPIIYFERGWNLEDERNTINHYITTYGYKECIEKSHDYLLLP